MKEEVKEFLLEVEFTFPEGNQTLYMPQLTRTYIHHFNDHKIYAKKWSGPAPWMGNAVGPHISPFTVIQAYCKTCEEKHGIFYLDRFEDVSGLCKDEPLSLEQAHEEVDKYINP